MRAFSASKKGVELLDASAGFVVVEQGVVGGRILLVAEGDGFPREVDHLREGGREAREIRRLLRLQPRGVGARLGAGVFVGEGGGQVLFLPVIAPKHLDGALLPIGQPLSVALERGQKTDVAFRVGEREDPLAEDRHILPRLIHSVLGTGTFEVEVQFADGAVVRLGFV